MARLQPRLCQSIGIVAVTREGFYLPQRTSSDIFKEAKAADLFGTDQIFATSAICEKMGASVRIKLRQSDGH
jgi:hypothetical protein